MIKLDRSCFLIVSETFFQSDPYFPRRHIEIACLMIQELEPSDTMKVDKFTLKCMCILFAIYSTKWLRDIRHILLINKNLGEYTKEYLNYRKISYPIKSTHYSLTDKFDSSFRTCHSFPVKSQ